MPWPVHPNGLLGAQGDNDTYQIQRSLRFNSADSAYLNRTFSTPTSSTIFTFSAWLKRSSLGSIQGIFAANPQNCFYFGSDDKLYLAHNNVDRAITSAVYRDTSAWYHTMYVQNGSSITLYINGSSVATGTASSFNINTAIAHYVGSTSAVGNFLNGYLTEINFIDGQALTPSSFGETDAITGRWKAKAYSGTYGTNGFYLKFSDNSGTTATTLGKDSSGNGNNWTPNNFSVTAGDGNDSLVDSPTNYGTDSGVGGEVRGNYCTLNPLDQQITSVGTLSNGNLDYTQTSATAARAGRATIGVSSGKWYWECTHLGGNASIGIANNLASMGTYVGGDANGWSYFVGGQKYTNNASASYGASYTTNDVIGVALDLDAGTLVFYKNGVSQGTAYSSLSGTMFPAISTSGVSSVSCALNFGQRPFAYTAPTGFKALCTTNIPTPTIKKPSSYMDVVTYTGNNSTNNITGLQFNPDLIWIKSRSSVTNHTLNDTVRGVGKDLFSNLTNAESTSNVITSFNSNGFSLGPDGGGSVNGSSLTYVAWAWDEAPIAGMDIVSYTGTGSARTVSHNLGVAPKMMIVKSRSRSGDNWDVYHAALGATKRAYLDVTNAADTTAAPWNNTDPTSSVFTVGTAGDTNASGVTYIAYLFAEVEGFSKFGSYTGNGSADGPFVWCGFRPRWVMYKRTDSTENWCIIDTARDISNVAGSQLTPNSSSAEGTGSSNMDAISNGFKIRSATAGGNVNGGTYIFAAFAESPFKYARAR